MSPRRAMGAAGLAAAVGLAGLAACGGGGARPETVAEFCKAYGPINDAFAAAGPALHPPAKPAQTKRAADTVLAEGRRLLDAHPPTAIAGAVKAADDAFTKLHAELAAHRYNISAFHGTPPALADPTFVRASNQIAAYGEQHCNIPPVLRRPGGPHVSPPSPTTG